MTDSSSFRKKIGSRLGRGLPTVVGVALLLGLWSLATLGAGKYFVPSPWTTIAETAVLLSQGSSWIQILITLMRILAGFLAGYITGVLAGMAMGARVALDALLKPLIVFFQGMPPLLWVIPITVVMGIGHLPTIIVIALITTPVVAVSVAEGMAGLPRTYREMLHVFAPGVIPRIKELVFPHLKPFLRAALNVGLGLAVKASVTAEYFGANNGIGFQVQAAYQSLRIRTLFSWGLVLILIILLFNHLIPRITALGPRIRGYRRRNVPLTHGPEDIEELRGIFTSRKSAPTIRLDGIGFSYGRGETLLQNIHFAVTAGEIAVITGDSGIGKTTLLKLIASLVKPKGGLISCPQRVGFAFQDDRLLPWRTIASNVALPLIHEGYPPASSLRFASYLLSEVGLRGDEGKMPDELSGGMKKRASLARCFARVPDAILLDEPFSGLHRDARSSLWNTLLRLLALYPVPVVMVTHFPDEISSTPACCLYALRGKPAAIVPMTPGRGN